MEFLSPERADPAGGRVIRAEEEGARPLRHRAGNYQATFTDFFYDDLILGVWKMMSVGAVLSSPAVDGATVYFGSADGNLYATAEAVVEVDSATWAA
ncbi:MAG TPA: PQQ-binding-like beta-propeller repeat protein [Steroidobacteraceae bacterium]|jgi:hypothetical protein|nr:PQQ-binding-like beta-propeller repeat protein [Steroidobacteraceae bacterium]